MHYKTTDTRPAIRPNRLIWEHANSFKDAALLCQEQGLPQPMAVNAALAIELYLKSFLALNVISTLDRNMGFASERDHIFTSLLNKFKVGDKALFLDQLTKVKPETNWLEQFQKFDHTFVKIRYWYETGNNQLINPDIVDLAVSVGEAVLAVGNVKHA